jgi:hypothetical protein
VLQFVVVMVVGITFCCESLEVNGEKSAEVKRDGTFECCVTVRMGMKRRVGNIKGQGIAKESVHLDAVDPSMSFLVLLLSRLFRGCYFISLFHLGHKTLCEV